MSDGPDPLGKRALFWAPAEREQDGPRRRSNAQVEGKRAFYSNVSNAEPRSGATTLVSDPDARGVPATTSTDLGFFGLVTIECSRCSERSQVSISQFVRLHVPFWLMKPGRGYTRLMTCPVCQRRSWVSASWKLPIR